MLKKIIIVCCSLLLVSCGLFGTKDEQEQAQVATTETECAFANERILETPPAWICGEAIPEAEVVALGKAEPNLVGGVMYQRSQAAIRARAQLLENLRSKAQEKIMQYLGSADDGAPADIEAVVQSALANIDSESLFGSTTYRTLSGPDGWFYLLLGMDKDSVGAAIAGAIGSSMAQDQALWEKFTVQITDFNLLESTDDS